MKENILESFLQVVPVLKDMLQEDITVSVVDKTSFLYYDPSSIVDLKINKGDSIPSNDPLYKSLRDGRIYKTVIPKEVYGIPFKGVTYPIKDSEGNIVGAVGIGKSLGEQFKVEESAETLFSSLEETSASIQEISSGSEKLNKVIENIVKAAKQAENNIKQSNEIITLIQNIASQSNLLGLNAAIEAARSGEHGRGFTVVASEMRKLAQLSGNSSEKVSKALSEISQNMEEIFKIINEAQSISENQAAATEEITSTLEEIIATAQIMADTVKVK